MKNEISCHLTKSESAAEQLPRRQAEFLPEGERKMGQVFEANR